MKKISMAVFAALLCFAASLHAQQQPVNPYDVLSRVLMPIASVFTPEAKQHALSATLVLEGMTDLPPELLGSRVELFLQPPDRALIRGVFAGQKVTICREGDAVWIAPNVPPFNALANPPGEILVIKKSKKRNSEGGGLGAMVLPFPPQYLALLPILFQVKDAGEEHGMRALDVKLMPELAKGLGTEEWKARITVNPASQLSQLRILGPGWQLSLRVERLEYATELPIATWQAPRNALLLNAQQTQLWIQEIGRQVELHRPARAE